MKNDCMFTSESVTEGHPDKLCDQISDAILDHFLEQDPYSRLVSESAVSNSIVFIAARFSSRGSIDFPHIAREVINQCGYDRTDFNSRTCSILTSLSELPPPDTEMIDDGHLTDTDIDRITAKNQANVFGFACRHTPVLMPLPIWLAHKLSRKLSAVRFKKILPYLSPDGKTQVGVIFKNRKPDRIHSITVITGQQNSRPGLKQLTDDLHEAVIHPIFLDENIQPDEKTRFFINPDGPLIPGGPSVHSGLTGRKNANDTYGEFARQSEGALSGKDPLRIDRIGAYAARHAAKNVVAAGLADECEVQLSYAIGLARPVSIQVQTFGSGTIPDNEIRKRLKEHFDFRLAAIIKNFRLRTLPRDTGGGFYRKLAAYGHVGRLDLSLPWELTDHKDKIV